MSYLGFSSFSLIVNVNIMKNMYGVRRKLLMKALLFFFIPLLVMSCFPDDSHFEVNDDLAGRLFEQINAEPRFSTTAKAIEMSGLEGFIGRAGLYTVYVPTNDAWDEYFQNHPSYNSLEDIPEQTLQEIVFYHAMVDMYFSFDYESGMERFFALGGKYITVVKNPEDGIVYVDDATFLPELSDINAENGAVHGINKVLSPKPNFSEFAIQHRTGDFGVFYELLEKFTRREVNESLSTPDQIVIDTISVLAVDFRNEDQLLTGLVFTDQAFNEWLNAQPQFNSLEDVPDYVLERIMNYHFIRTDPDGGAAKTAQELYASSVETSADEMLTLKPEFVRNESLEISNGNGIVVDKLLIPPSFSSVAGYPTLNPDQDMMIFYSVMDRAGFYDDLSDESKAYTLFAPTDAAFKAAGIDTTTVKSMTGGELESILRYHLLPTEVMADQLTNGYIQNQQGSYILVNGTTLTGTDNDNASITATNFDRTNGVVHKINTVLTPPPFDLFNTLTEDIDNSYATTIQAIDMVGKTEDVLAGNLTILAPNNAAWQSYFDSRPDVVGLVNFQDKIEELDSIISNHIVKDKSIFTLELSDGDQIYTLMDTLTVIKSGVDVQLSDQNPNNSDARVTKADWQATNGVIQVINRILLPE